MTEALAYAVGVAVSPVPIGASVLLLSCPRAVANSSSFAGGWIVGISALAAACVVLVTRAGLSDSDPVWIGLPELALGCAFLIAAAIVWTRRGRRTGSPAWLAALDGFTPARSAGLGFLLSGANPKAFALALGVALALADADASRAEAARSVVAFTVVGALGVTVPLAIYVAAPTRAAALLLRVRAWLVRHDAAVLSVLGVLLGALFVADGISAL